MTYGKQMTCGNPIHALHRVGGEAEGGGGEVEGWADGRDGHRLSSTRLGAAWVRHQARAAFGEAKLRRSHIYGNVAESGTTNMYICVRTEHG